MRHSAKYAITSIAAATMVATAMPALAATTHVVKMRSFEVQQDLTRCMRYETHLTGHQCQMKYDPDYRARIKKQREEGKKPRDICQTPYRVYIWQCNR